MTTNPSHSAMNASTASSQGSIPAASRMEIDAALYVLADPNQAGSYDTACLALTAHMSFAPSKAYIRDRLHGMFVESKVLRDWFQNNSNVTRSADGYNIASHARLVLIGVGGNEFINAVNLARSTAGNQVSQMRPMPTQAVSTAVDLELPLDGPASPPAPAGVQLADAERAPLRKPGLNRRITP